MIRNAKMTDAKEIMNLSIQLGYPVTQEQVESRLERLLNHKDHGVFVFEKEDMILGWTHVYGKCLIELEYAEIGGLVVDESCRKQGIGEKLMRKCEEWARNNGWHEMRLRSREHRLEAHQFYKKIGYENIYAQQVFYLKL